MRAAPAAALYLSFKNKQISSYCKLGSICLIWARLDWISCLTCWYLELRSSSNLTVSLLRVDLGIGVPRVGVIAILDSMPKVSMAVTKVI